MGQATVSQNEPNPPSPGYITVQQICEELGVGRNVVLDAIRTGQLPAVRANRGGRPFEIERSALEQWLGDQKQATRRYVSYDRWAASAMWDPETGEAPR